MSNKIEYSYCLIHDDEVKYLIIADEFANDSCYDEDTLRKIKIEGETFYIQGSYNSQNYEQRRAVLACVNGF
jgi:hypothetical protein